MRDLEAQARRLGGRAMLHQHPQARRCSKKCPTWSSSRPSSPARSAPEFLTLPAEVLTTTLIHHQHFFPVVDATGALMPAFLAVTNTQAANDRGIATNAERVVTARLRDARFFWDADRQVGLEARLRAPRDGCCSTRRSGRTRRRPRASRNWRAGSPRTCSSARDAGRRGRACGPAGEGRSRHRHGARVHRAAGRDGRRLRARSRRARSRCGRRSITSTCRSRVEADGRAVARARSARPA